jgi:hypothetical protein
MPMTAVAILIGGMGDPIAIIVGITFGSFVKRWLSAAAAAFAAGIAAAIALAEAMPSLGLTVSQGVIEGCASAVWASIIFAIASTIRRRKASKRAVAQ